MLFKKIEEETFLNMQTEVRKNKLQSWIHLAISQVNNTIWWNLSLKSN